MLHKLFIILNAWEEMLTYVLIMSTLTFSDIISEFRIVAIVVIVDLKIVSRKFACMYVGYVSL